MIIPKTKTVIEINRYRDQDDNVHYLWFFDRGVTPYLREMILRDLKKEIDDKLKEIDKTKEQQSVQEAISYLNPPHPGEE